MMKIRLLGTASAAGSNERDNTYLLLENKEKAWLVDVGGNPLGKLKQANVPLDKIEGVLITHMHIDHYYGLPSLLWGMWIAGRVEPLTIYCSSTSERQLRQLIEGYAVYQWPIKFEINLLTFDWNTCNTIITTEDLQISTFPAIHGVPNVGIVIQWNKQMIVYSSDSTPNQQIKDLKHIDLLIHEANRAYGESRNHTSLDQLMSYYDWDCIQRVIAIHLSDNEPYEQVIHAYPMSKRNKLELAADMQIIELS